MTINKILTDRLEKDCIDLAKVEWDVPNAKITTPTRFTAHIIEDIRNMYIAIEDMFNDPQIIKIFV